MRTFVVQPASASVLHCYVGGGKPFDDRAAGRVSQVSGVRGVHLVTVGRSPSTWCMVLEPSQPVEQGNAEILWELIGAVARRVGCRSIQLLRPPTRSQTERGHATDIYDWLKW